MKEQLKMLRKQLGITQQEFADKLGVSRNNIAGYETGKSDPGDAVVSLICREFSVNEEWLRTGKGEMFEKLTEQEKIMKYTAMLLKDTDSTIARYITNLIVTYEQLDDHGKATLEQIAVKYLENLKKSQ